MRDDRAAAPHLISMSRSEGVQFPTRAHMVGVRNSLYTGGCGQISCYYTYEQEDVIRHADGKRLWEVF